MEKQQKEISQQIRKTEDVVEIDLLELCYYFLSKIWYIIAGFVIAGLISALVTIFLITPLYTATAKLYMVSSSKGSVVDISDLNIGTNLSADYVQLVKTRPIIEAVIEELELPYTYDQMIEMLDVSTINNTRILVLKFTSPDAKEAKDVVNTLAEEAVSRLPKLMDTPEPHIAEEAIIPEQRSSPSYTKNTLVAALAGMILVMGVLTLFYLLDDTLESAEDLEKAFGITPLTVIPEGDVGILSEQLEHIKVKRRLFKRKITGKGSAS